MRYNVNQHPFLWHTCHTNLTHYLTIYNELNSKVSKTDMSYDLHTFKCSQWVIRSVINYIGSSPRFTNLFIRTGLLVLYRWYSPWNHVKLRRSFLIFFRALFTVIPFSIVRSETLSTNLQYSSAVFTVKRTKLYMDVYWSTK